MRKTEPTIVYQTPCPHCGGIDHRAYATRGAIKVVEGRRRRVKVQHRRCAGCEKKFPVWVVQGRSVGGF